jgi:hypothetical protein
VESEKKMKIQDKRIQQAELESKRLEALVSENEALRK